MGSISAASGPGNSGSRKRTAASEFRETGAASTRLMRWMPLNHERGNAGKM